MVSLVDRSGLHLSVRKLGLPVLTPDANVVIFKDSGVRPVIPQGCSGRIVGPCKTTLPMGIAARMMFAL